MNDFSKEDTTIIKGIAIILMFIHHLFGFEDRIVDYISVFSINNIRIEQLVGQFGKICVPIYIFLSGYGLYKSTEKEHDILSSTIKRIFNFIINYWIIFIIFIPIGLIFFYDSSSYIKDVSNNNIRYTRNIIIFLKNLFMISSSFNREWWFVSLYIELLIIFPYIYKLTLSDKKIIFIISPIISIISSIVFNIILTKSNILFIAIDNILIYQIYFVYGLLFSKYNLLNNISINLERRLNKVNLILIFVIIFVIRTYASLISDCIYIDLLIVPILILVIRNINIGTIKIKKIFLLLGHHSTNMWLTHTFFCYYYFQKFIYYPKLSILILLNLIIICTLVSIFINYIYIKVIENKYIINFKICILNYITKTSKLKIFNFITKGVEM